jgi:hypothetical protein
LEIEIRWDIVSSIYLFEFSWNLSPAGSVNEYRYDDALTFSFRVGAVIRHLPASLVGAIHSTSTIGFGTLVDSVLT